jgi:dihydrofolate reductase
MGKVVYSMTVSLDGFIAGPGGEIDWTAPDEELHRFHNDQARELGAHICGRRLYQEMLYWETADQSPSASDIEIDFAQIWQRLPKVVFSTTLDKVQGNTRLATARPAIEVARIKEHTEKDVAVGGARLAATFVHLDLIDEYLLFVRPIVIGGGTPYFPPSRRRLGLELVETRTFGSRVVHLRYRRVRS